MHASPGFTALPLIYPANRISERVRELPFREVNIIRPNVQLEGQMNFGFFTTGGLFVLQICNNQAALRERALLLRIVLCPVAEHQRRLNLFINEECCLSREPLRLGWLRPPLGCFPLDSGYLAKNIGTFGLSGFGTTCWLLGCTITSMASIGIAPSNTWSPITAAAVTQSRPIISTLIGPT